MRHLYLFFIGLGFVPFSQSSTVAQGEHLYQSCVGCHSPSYNRTGPKRCFLFGRKVGTQKIIDTAKQCLILTGFGMKTHSIVF